MMKKKLLTLIFGIVILFSTFSLILAAPPFVSAPTTIEGITIEHPIADPIKTDTFHEFHFHIFNATTGMPMNGTGVTCFFHLYNSSGMQTYTKNNVPLVSSELFDYEVNLTKGNFTSGQGSFIFQCNTSNQGGFYEHDYQVTPTGTTLSTSEAVLYGFVLLLIGLFLFFSISGIMKTEDGTWMIAYICLTYIFIYGLVGIFYLLARDFLWTMPVITNILYIIWFIMGVGFLPFTIILSLYILGKETRAALEKDYMKQGYSRDEARELSKRKR